MNKLSRREKILIYVLACFLIGMFGLYFIVKPSLENYSGGFRSGGRSAIYATIDGNGD